MLSTVGDCSVTFVDAAHPEVNDNSDADAPDQDDDCLPALLRT